MTWRNNTCDVNYSPSLFTFLQIINTMKLTWFCLCFIIKFLDKRIIYTKCMYNCLYHVSSWYVKQLYIHNVYIMCCIFIIFLKSCYCLSFFGLPLLIVSLLVFSSFFLLNRHENKRYGKRHVFDERLYCLNLRGWGQYIEWHIIKGCIPLTWRGGVNI